MSPRLWVVLGSLAGALGVGLGAFGAHGLRGRVEPRMLEVFETGVRYQLVHALALLAVAWCAHRWPSPWIHAAGWLILAGIVVFSGSLYLLVFTGARGFGAVPPLGGLALILGWLVLAAGVLRAG